LPGISCDLEGALLNVADHNLQTLTHCELAFIPRSAVRDLILSHPRIGMAMWVDTLIDSSIFREWVVNVGRRDGRARIAHLICEFARRMEVAGLADAAGYELPLTQEQIADATGLTAVHVNRVLKTLTSEGLICRTRRVVSIPNWAGLRAPPASTRPISISIRWRPGQEPSPASTAFRQCRTAAHLPFKRIARNAAAPKNDLP
jgi:CRP-like cAMP-binding protein